MYPPARDRRVVLPVLDLEYTRCHYMLPSATERLVVASIAYARDFMIITEGQSLLYLPKNPVSTISLFMSADVPFVVVSTASRHLG